MKILFTGFEPFDGASVNASYEAVRRLPASIAGAAVETALLKTEFDGAVHALKRLLSDRRPDAVICVGQAAGRGSVTPEKVAINYADAGICDNAGFRPADRPRVPGGPAAYFSTLPVRAIAGRIAKEGIPAAVSYSAGTFVCNCVMYHLLKTAHEQYPEMKAGFIHVPLCLEQESGGGRPALPIEKITRALWLAAEETLSCRGT